MSIKLIAEIGSNHNQELDRTMELIEEAKRIGCDAVKFQLFKAEKLYREKEDQAKIKANELPESFIPLIAHKCKKLDIEFGCTPFDFEAIEILAPFVDFYKIASYDLLREDFIKKVCGKGKPIITSTGMLNEDEIEELYYIFRWNRMHKKLSMLHCVADYPCKIEDCNMSIVVVMNRGAMEFCKNGWSDHSKNPSVLYAAAGAGADIIEFHLDLDDMQGNEYKFGHCWTVSKIESVIKTIRQIEIALGYGNKILTKNEKANLINRASPIDGKRPFICI